MQDKKTGSKILIGILVVISCFAIVIFTLLIMKTMKSKEVKEPQGSVSRLETDTDEETVDFEETSSDDVADGDISYNESEVFDKDDPLIGEGEEFENSTSTNTNSGTTTIKPSSGSTLSDAELLNAVYSGTTLAQGDIHAHLDNDGRADETTSLKQWKSALAGLELDFVASLDHYQTSHFDNASWSTEKFLYGTEAETSIKGKNPIHFNMYFAGSNAATMLRNTLSSAGMLAANGKDYKYVYNQSEAWFGNLIQTVQNNGGFFVIPHPNQKRGNTPYASSALGYVFKGSNGKAVERIGFEVMARSAYDSETAKNYEYWKQLLNAGYKYYACAGSDIHGDSGQKGGDGNLVIKKAITSIYTKSSEKNDAGYLKQLKSGNFTAGAVGIKMCIGSPNGGSVVAMGGECDFNGKRLVVQIGEFYNYLNRNAMFRVEIHTENGIVHRQNIRANENAVIAINTDVKAKYYRVEVRYAESNTCVAYGNPIWNTNEVK